MKKKVILVLHSRLSDYFLNTFSEFKKYNNEVDIHIIYKLADANQAPFKFDFKEYKLFLYEQSKFDFNDLVKLTKHIDPQIIICNSWGDKKYLKLVSKYKNNCKTIMNMDNQFYGTLKQYLGIIYSRLYLTKIFDKVWVPGIPQKKFAIKLGFMPDSIMTGWYVANEKLFKSMIPTVNKRFVFVGRYIELKGIRQLCNSFIKLQNNYPCDWELHCIGVGPLSNQLPIHEKIKHLGFKQPIEMRIIMKEGGVFVLPSFFEPWGVVVHEFSMAGFPLICSSKVGAATEFINNKNGIIYNPKNNGLYESLKEFTKKDFDDLLNMSKESIKQSNKITLTNWIDKLKNEL